MQTQVNFRIDAKIKMQMEEILQGLGMTTTVAFNLFAHAVIRERGIPLNLKLEHPKDCKNDEIDFENVTKG